MEKTKTCPHCKEQIEDLNFDVTGTCGSSLTIDEVQNNKGCLEAYDSDSLMASVQFDNFSCPECGENICFKEENAIKFLSSK